MSPLDNLDRGAAADQPPAGPYNKDKFWFSNDTGELSVSDGTAWTVINGGGGGGGIGFGGVATFGDIIPNITANNAFTNLKNGGGDYSVDITNPLAVDAWVSGVLQISEVQIALPGYVGPLYWRHQVNLQAGAIPGGGGLVDMGGVDQANQAGLPAVVGTHFLKTLERPFGLVVPAGATANATLLHAMWLSDGGANGNYGLSFNSNCRIVYSGVPLS